MSVTTITVSPGDDLYRIAAKYYGTADGWAIIAQANGLVDPVIQKNQLLNIPEYSTNRAADGVYGGS